MLKRRNNYECVGIVGGCICCYVFSCNCFPGIIICNDLHVITVSLKNFEILKDFEKGLVKTFYTYKKTRFLIQILLKTASSYLKVLNIVNKDIEVKEKK